MTAPAGNNVTNSALNLNSAAKPALAAPGLNQKFIFNDGHNIYIRAAAEFHLFTLWITFSQPDIHIAFSREVLETTVGLPATYVAPQELKRAVEAENTEQERRFALVVCKLTPLHQYELMWDCDGWLQKPQTRDIEYMRDMLGWLRFKLVKIQGVLQAQLEDEMADFDDEDFKRMEKENERSREQRQKQKEVFAADFSFWATLRTSYA